MNVYDFDGTIYDGDSTLDFYFFCLKKHPNIIMCIPRQCVAAICYKMKRIEKTEFKERFYGFLGKLGNVDTDVKEFWDSYEYRIKSWYKEKQKKDDVVISASPDFLLREICERNQIKCLIASRVNPENGKYDGANCYGKEKVRRFCEMMPEAKIDEFYSDSYSDEPLARLAEKAYVVKKNEIKEW